MTQEYFGKDLEAMSFAHNYHKWIINEFAPYLGRTMAEVGAGTGNFSQFLLQAGVEQLVAYEPSDNMFAQLETQFADVDAVTSVNGFFEDDSNDYLNTFDSVCYVNVLEHIEDDVVALQHAYKTLKVGGHILIFVPALAFLYSELDRKVGHFRRYSKKGLVEVAESAGFVINKTHYFDMLGIVPWYIAFVLLKQTTTEANVSLYDKLVVPLASKLEPRLRPFIGKNLVLVGTKKG